MANSKRKLGFVIGRFQPLHPGHRDLIRQASKHVDRLLIMVGSVNRPRSIKNPWTFFERRDMIEQFLSHEGITNAIIVPVNDYKYSDSQWIQDVTSVVTSHQKNPKNVYFLGFEKPGNDYLNWFPQYDYINIDTQIDITATKIRESILMDSQQHHRVSENVVADWKYFQDEKARFANYPFPETLNFACGDAILECAGHILLIQRGKAPGKDTWGLPGGFKNNNETFFDCAIRELNEETQVKVAEKVIRGSVVSTELFDSPTRGMGIPRTTLAVHIRIHPNHDGSLPKFKASDDAQDCKWVSTQEVMDEYQLFDDHQDIISKKCGVMPTPAHKNPRYFRRSGV